ncbi:transglutaminase-like putative cysteine protease [Amycolatopsis lexingtonensis]|uniref:Transglutaminase-like putative cysteine protease n=1 Tax=Amycolatopsis lexingtonensis TaxID=218822 RepID=A0ABR9IB12_9PSEU|nr:transglutaminase domain-containing protein [Amycolatopsis lexingtonensis]MBE1500365.1 transglutaminase-like putative cysteine protease [Amycolatopsis lexingtonensis]
MSPVPSPTSDRLSDYLAADDVVDHRHPLIRARVDALRATNEDPAEAAFRFVRDEVEHVIDARDPRVTWRASDVLRERVGICYAKAHLLAALLRAQGIPAGFCYQELSALHGLNAVYLHGKWARLDARGNRTGARGEFSLDEEKLAWPVDTARGERDLREIHPAPAPVVVEFLMTVRPGPGWYENGLPATL